MKQDLADKLYTNYPGVFPDKLHLEVGDGWYNILDKMCWHIEHHLSSLPEESKGQIFAFQIKEKFGSLRAYFSHTTPFMDGVIAMAEGFSSSTCEVCGMPGQKRTGGWIKVLCDEHHKK